MNAFLFSIDTRKITYKNSKITVDNISKIAYTKITKKERNQMNAENKRKRPP